MAERNGFHSIYMATDEPDPDFYPDIDTSLHQVWIIRSYLFSGRDAFLNAVQDARGTENTFARCLGKNGMYSLFVDRK